MRGLRFRCLRGSLLICAAWNRREVVSSLEDLEVKYAKALEERFFSSTNYRIEPLWKRTCSVFATNLEACITYLMDDVL